jgi:hypothetical protein
MSYTDIALKDKIIEIYPEITGHNISFSLEFNNERNLYILRFIKGRRELITYLEKRDADECIKGIKCIHLALQIKQFIKDLERVS